MVVDDTIGASELFAVVVAMLLPPLVLASAIELLVRRLRARTSDPPRRARLAQRMVLPLVCFSAISGFLTAFGSLFLSRFLYF